MWQRVRRGAGQQTSHFDYDGQGMQIAILTGDVTAPSETFVRDQGWQLMEAGHEVSVYTRPPAGSPESPDEAESGAWAGRIHVWPVRPGGWLARCRDAWRRYRGAGSAERACLRQALHGVRFGRDALSGKLFYESIPFLPGQSFDVIHAQFGPRGVIAHRLRRLGVLRGPLVVSFHGEDASVRSGSRTHRAYRAMFEAVDLVTVNSAFTGRRVERLGCPPQIIRRVPMGVDLDRLVPSGAGSNDAMACDILTVARLVEVKGIGEAIRAVSRLVSRFPELRYHVMGEGPLRPELEQLIGELQLEGHVRLLGARPHAEVMAACERARLFVLPSVTLKDDYAEAQGLVLLEAQAMKLPVVATRSGGIPDSIAEGESGLLVPERDPERLAEAIAGLLEDPARCEAMGRAGRAFVEQHFSRARVTEKLLRAYREAMDRHAARGRG